MKRIFDFVLSSLGIVISAPLAILFALLIKCGDAGPIFYFQERWGKDGRKFKAYKFRTMLQDADRRWGSKPAQENDFRVTRIGKFLRATALDELPQLFNIWKGDMSLVGPRALAVVEVDPSIPGFYDRHKIRPGLTGPTQVFTSRDASLQEKFCCDLDYIKNRSLWGDLRLVILSVGISLRGKWESRQKKV